MIALLAVWGAVVLIALLRGTYSVIVAIMR